MQKRVSTLTLVFFGVWGMDVPVVQPDDVHQIVTTAYRMIVVPHIEHLQLLREQLENNFLTGNIHGILRMLVAVRRSGFRLVREYRRFDVQMRNRGIGRPSCASARQLLTRFMHRYASWISDHINDFFSTTELSDIFIAEQIDWTEPFLLLGMLLDAHEDVHTEQQEQVPVAVPTADELIDVTSVHPIIEDERCAGADLAESFDQHDSAADRRCCCWLCLFK